MFSLPGYHFDFSWKTGLWGVYATPAPKQILYRLLDAPKGVFAGLVNAVMATGFLLFIVGSMLLFERRILREFATLPSGEIDKKGRMLFRWLKLSVILGILFFVLSGLTLRVSRQTSLMLFRLSIGAIFATYAFGASPIVGYLLYFVDTVAKGREVELDHTAGRALNRSVVIAPILAMIAIVILRERVIYLDDFYGLLLRGVGVTVGSSAYGLSVLVDKPQAFLILPIWLLAAFLLIPLLSMAAQESSSLKQILRSGLLFTYQNLRRFLLLVLAVIGCAALPVMFYSIVGLAVPKYSVADLVVDTVATSVWIIIGMIGFVAIHKFVCDYSQVPVFDVKYQ